MDKDQIKKDMCLEDKKMSTGKESGSDNPFDVHATDPQRLTTSDHEKAMAEIERRMKRLTNNEVLRCKALLEGKGIHLYDIIREGVNMHANMDAKQVEKAKGILKADGYTIYKSTVAGQLGSILFEAKGDTKG